MRPARLTAAAPAGRLAVVLVAHGSRDPRAAASTEALARAVRRRHPSWEVHASYLDHAGPRPLDVLASLAPGRRAVLVPLLLTAAYHGRVDVPAVVAEAAHLPIEVHLADVLGAAPSGLLLDAVLRRLTAAAPLAAAGEATVLDTAGPHAAGLDAAGPDVAGPDVAGLDVAGLDVAGLDAVVLAAAGTRDAAARETIKDAAHALSARLGLPCAVAYASAAPPDPGAAVAALRADGARRVGVAAYFLAPGYLYDVAIRSAREAGAVAIADPLGDAPELVRLVGSRVEAALSRTFAAAA
jgi:sirohydrochlorin ferrochelatase